MKPVVASDKLERTELWAEDRESVHWAGAFAVYGGHGTTASSTIPRSCMKLSHATPAHGRASRALALRLRRCARLCRFARFSRCSPRWSAPRKIFVGNREKLGF